ncbi:redoxin family protein [Sphingomonas flavalba]|uniref:redoxin family protein n=1 Tax=Sphingomonas flavalba TaxID=2559804 RepID=UPI0039E185B3
MRSSIALFLALGLIAGCDRQSGDTPQPAPTPEQAAPVAPSSEKPLIDASHKGKPAPAEAFTAPDGRSVTLAAFKGKPLLVNLWATWCVPCVTEMPTLDALAAREAGKLQVLVISQDLQGREKVDPFFAKGGFKALKPYIDPENAIGFALSGGQLPTTVLFDADGKEVWRVTGGLDWAGDQAKTLLAQLGE